MTTDLRGRRKPTVRKHFYLWEVCVTYGFEGNYEHMVRWFATWREAFDWAYEEVQYWRP